MTIVFIGGIRTHYIKINALQKVIAKLDNEITRKFNFIYIDTAQHYDEALNGFIDELGLHFDYRLSHDSKNPYDMISTMLIQLGKIFDEINAKTQIDYVAVLGDVTTTIISAIAAKFKSLKTLHIEAGARVGRGAGVEEYFRTAVDHISTMCFAATQNDYDNLVAEGLEDYAFFSGDIIYDYLKDYSYEHQKTSFLYKSNGTLKSFKCDSTDYIFSSIHHAENLDPLFLNKFFVALRETGLRTIFIAHPRIKKIIENNNIGTYDTVIADYIPYLENLCAIKNCKFVVTDSGGVQREAYYLDKRCVVRSDLNVWKCIVECGSNRIASKDFEGLLSAFEWANKHYLDSYEYNGCFGDGNAVKNILETVLCFDKQNFLN